MFFHSTRASQDNPHVRNLRGKGVFREGASCTCSGTLAFKTTFIKHGELYSRHSSPPVLLVSCDGLMVAHEAHIGPQPWGQPDLTASPAIVLLSRWCLVMA